MAFTPFEMDGQEAARTMLSWGTEPTPTPAEQEEQTQPNGGGK